jgi:hypothetical protein
MNPKTFEQNIHFLSQRAPETAQKILHAPIEGMQAEFVQTKTNVPSLRIVPEGMSSPILLHSAYDPMREATRWAEGITINESLNVFLLGFGLGYQILTFLKQHASKTRFLFIVEQDPRIARIAFSSIDFRPVINREGTFWLIGEQPEEIPELIGERRTDIILHNFRIFSHDASLKCNPTYYDAVQHSLLDAVTYDEVNLRTNMENRGRNQFNILMNLPSIYKGYFLNPFKNAFQGYPGIVSAAGPSLDRNIDQIVSRGDKAPLFIVDTAQKTFQNHNIQPDFVVTADPTPLNFSHFEQIDSLGDAFFAFHPEVNRKITEKFIHHPYLLPLFDGESDYLDFLFDAENRCGTMDRAMNVGHIAFNLAVYMGCDPIILVGFDYAFPPKGGTTHAKDAAMSRDILDSKEDGTTTISGKDGRAGVESGRMNFVNGYYGGKVLTTTPFIQYINALERSVKEYGVRVIDATEGGAAFQQTTRIPLAEALSTELKQAGIAAVIQNLRLQRSEHDFQTIRKRLEESKQVLIDGQKICHELLNTLLEWKERIRKGPVESKEATALWDAFNKKWMEMVAPPMFDTTLGTSAQYIYFRRQKTEPLADNSGTAYLQCMGKKYDFVLNEMNGLLSQFIQHIDLAAEAFQLRIQAEGTK